MANENAVLLAPHVDSCGRDSDVTQYDMLVAEMISVRDDLVKFSQSLQCVANPSTDSLDNDLLFGAAKTSRHLGREGKDAQTCFTAATARNRYTSAVTLQLAAEMSNLLGLWDDSSVRRFDGPAFCNLRL